MRKKKEIVPISKADRDFFQRFYEEHRQLLYYAAGVYTPDAAEREDVVQEALIRLMKKISVLRDLTRYKAVYYIVLTVRTTYIDMLRTQQKLTTVPLDEEAVMASICGNDVMEGGESDDSAKWAVTQLKENLSERDWMILTGKFIMEYSHEELSALLGIDPVNIRMVLSRAKKRARKLLQQEGWMEDD